MTEFFLLEKKMEIRDIIQTEKDRLFIVDPECYVLFTGDSTDDLKPFIRIGNWINMPVELIPLIENIIITDSLLGNPSLEQFNIDIQLLRENRYIGSRNIVSRYLEFQKIFGLDLTNATVVDIEKDIPEITREPISGKNQFTGVFYRDGNLKILHGDDIILDLKAAETETVNYRTIFDRIRDQSSGSESYMKSGIVIVDHNPLFYNRNRFTAYLFPTYVFTDFSRLGIDPARIRNLVYPSTNFINLTKLLKWVGQTQGAVKIYNDSGEMMEPVKKLFSGATIIRENFTGMEISEDGLTVTGYPGTFNIRLRYNRMPPDGNEFVIAFIKTAGGVDGIVKEKPDAIVITYSAFEDTNLLLRSSDVPLVVVPDGNPGIIRLAHSDLPVLKEGVRYEFHSTADPSHLWLLSGLDRQSLEQALASPSRSAAGIVGSQSASEGDADYRIRLRNILSIIALELNSTEDRAYAKSLKSIASDIRKAAEKPPVTAEELFLQAHIVFHNGYVYEFHEAGTREGATCFFEDPTRQGTDSPVYYDEKQIKFFERIREDRARLQSLLDLYFRENGPALLKDRDLAALKTLIEKRKEDYHSSRVSTETRVTPRDDDMDRNLLADREKVPSQKHEGAPLPDPRAAFKARPQIPRRKALMLSLLLAAAVIIALGAIFAGRYFITSGTSSATGLPGAGESIPAEEPEESVHIDDRDIFHYANRVALKNGYHALVFSRFKEKNPDWIYPSNVFTMLDGERVTVKYGDTLWELSRKKLVKMEKEFGALMEKAASASGREERQKLLKQAKDFAFRKSHFSAIQEMNDKDRTK